MKYQNKYFVLRHGWSEANEAGLINSAGDRKGDFGLTKKGRRQIEMLDTGLLGAETIIVTSDFRRTRETAAVIAQKLGATRILEAVELREKNFGEFDGLADDEFRTADPHDPRHQTVETLQEIIARVRRLIEGLEKEYHGETILLVSHGDTIKALEGVLYGISPKSIGYIKYRDQGELHEIGDVPPVDFPNTFYRVSLKAVIKNNKNQVLCVKEDGSDWSLPGGGLDHGEAVLDGLARELNEEISSARATFSATPKGIDTMWIGSKRAWLMWIVYVVKFENFGDFRPGVDADEIGWIDAATLRKSPSRLERMAYKWAFDQSFVVERW